MTNINVQFQDDSEEVVISYFGCPQDEEIYPHQGTLMADDARWEAYYNAQPQPVQIWLPAPVKN